MEDNRQITNSIESLVKLAHPILIHTITQIYPNLRIVILLFFSGMIIFRKIINAQYLSYKPLRTLPNRY